MRPRRRVLGSERGVALVLALMILLTLTGLVLAFLSESAIEPQIARNLSDTARARYLAEAGLEVGFNALIVTNDSNNSWTGLLATATTSSPWVVLPNMSAAALPGLTSTSGTYTVSVRNDYQASDDALTGTTVDTNVTTDGNKIVVLRTTGTSNCDNDSQWSLSASNPAKYAMSTNTGTKSNVGITYEARVEGAFGTSGS